MPANAKTFKAALLLIALTVAAYFVICGTWTGWDDAFITYRIANNNVHSHWFHWNVSEAPVNAATSFLWLMLMTGIGFCGIAMPIASVVLGVAFHASASVLAWKVVGGKSGLLAGILVAVDGFGAWASVGMETWMFISLLLAVVLAYDRDRSVLAAGLCGLLILARPDGVLLAILIFADWVAIRGRAPWRESLAIGASVIPWSILCLIIFAGGAIPTGMEAKQVQAHVGIIGAYTWTSFEYFLLKVPYVLLGLSLLTAWFIRRRALYVLLIFAVASHAAYSIARIAAFPWYYAPMMVCLWIVAASLLEALRGHLIQTVFLVCLIVCSAVLFFRYADADSIYTGQSGERERSVARYLREHTHVGDVLVTEQIGIIGYYNPTLEVHDILGIVCPEWLLPLKKLRVTESLITLQPEWVVFIVGKRIGWPKLLLDPSFSKNYVVRSFDSNMRPAIIIMKHK